MDNINRRDSMKKILLTLVAAMFIVSCTCALAFAGDSTKIVGKVKAIDTAKGEITICPSGTKEDKVFKVDKDMLEKKKITVGAVVNAYLEKEGSNVIKKIHKAAAVPVGC